MGGQEIGKEGVKSTLDPPRAAVWDVTSAVGTFSVLCPCQCCGVSSVPISYKHLPAFPCSENLCEVKGIFCPGGPSTKEVDEQSHGVVMVITVISKLLRKIA